MLVALWLPRADEHALAASLGLCEPDAALARELLEAARETLHSDHPNWEIRVGRWHVWRVVRAMHRAGFTNTPDGRAGAFAFLATNTE